MFVCKVCVGGGWGVGVGVCVCPISLLDRRSSGANCWLLSGPFWEGIPPDQQCLIFVRLYEVAATLSLATD